MVAEIVDSRGNSLSSPQQFASPKTRTFAPEVGSTGLRRFAGYVSEDFDPQLNGSRGVAAFDEMRRNDPDVGAVLSAIEYIIHSVDWSVAPGGETQADLDAASFLRECMEDMDFSWHELISDICSMFPFGWAFFEIIYKQRNGLEGYEGEEASLFDDGRIGWAKIALRGQESLDRWEFDEKGNVLGMYQRVLWSPAPQNTLQGGKNAVASSYYIPMDKSVLFRVKREKNNPEGWSILRTAYRPYFIKKNIEEIEVQGAEKDMVGTLVIRMPANATAADREVAMRVLEDYHSGDQTGILLPRTVNDPTLLDLDWTAELMKSPGSKVVDTDKIINRCSVMITRTSLAQFLTLGQNRAGGSRALGESMMDLFNISVNGHLDNIEAIINRHMVRRLFELNSFPGMTKLPSITHANLGEMTVKDFVDAVTKLHNTGYPLDDPDAVNLTRKKLGFPDLDSDYLQQRSEIEYQAKLAQKTPSWPESNQWPADTRHNPHSNDLNSGGGKPPQRGPQPLATNKSASPVKKTASEWAEWLASV